MARNVSKRQSKRDKQLALDSGCTALYIRVSTEKQADEGFSLEAQEKQLRALCEAHGWNICEDHIYTDAGVSGKTSDRPAFQQMMTAAKSGAIRRIVAAKLDRLARNVRDFLATVDLLKDSECALVLVKESFDTSTPHGKFALTMFAAMAELEASTITERVMTGKRQKAGAGGYNGAYCPLGYTYDGEQFALADNAGTVQRIFAEYTDGASLAEIADALNRDKLPTRRGGAWHPSTVRYILTNGFYAGLMQWDGEEVIGDHPAIVERSTYEQAHKIMKAARPGPKAID